MVEYLDVLQQVDRFFSVDGDGRERRETLVARNQRGEHVEGPDVSECRCGALVTSTSVTAHVEWHLELAETIQRALAAARPSGTRPGEEAEGEPCG